MESLLSYDEWLVMAASMGFRTPDEVVGRELYEGFIARMEDKLRDVIKVSILDADNRGKTELDEHSLEAAKKQIRIFPTVATLK